MSIIWLILFAVFGLGFIDMVMLLVVAGLLELWDKMEGK